MEKLSHLDQLEAEAIYIFNRKGQLSNASSCNEGILS